MSLRTRIMQEISQAHVLEDLGMVERSPRPALRAPSPKEAAATEAFRKRFMDDMSWIGQRRVPRWNAKKKVSTTRSPMFVDWFND